jgi:aldose 1-epimerase
MGAVSAPAATGAIELQAGASRLLVCPEIGGAIARFTWRGLDILRPATDAAIAGASVRLMACYPLVPYSNRIEGARLVFDGEVFPLQANFPPEPHAIHGVGWRRAWTLSRHADAQLQLLLVHEPDAEWPFGFEARQVLTLGEGRLTAALALKNTDARPMPAGLGFHPFFPLVPGLALETEWKGAWRTGEDNLPTQWEPLPADADFRRARPIGAWKVDRCFTGWSRLARLDYPDHRVELSASAALERMVCFVPGDGRAFIALEPVSHVNNAFAMAARGVADTGMRVLAPGEAMQASMTIAVGAAA